MFFVVDDIGIKYLNQLYKLESLKKRYSNLRVTCFVIAKDLTPELIRWLKQDWIEVAVHCYEHTNPPECERNDKEERIKMALNILKPLLPEKFGFRAPGFQMTATTYPILRKLGFWYIAHQNRIQLLKEIDDFQQDVLINTHIYDNNLDYGEQNYKFISEGFL